MEFNKEFTEIIEIDIKIKEYEYCYNIYNNTLNIFTEKIEPKYKLINLYNGEAFPINFNNIIGSIEDNLNTFLKLKAFI